MDAYCEQSFYQCNQGVKVGKITSGSFSLKALDKVAYYLPFSSTRMEAGVTLGEGGGALK